MGFEFKSDQPEQKMVDNTTTLSVNNGLVGEQAVATIVEVDETTTSGSDETMDLVQSIFTEEEEMRLAIQFIEENALYTKFLLWCGIQDQLKQLKDSLDTTKE